LLILDEVGRGTSTYDGISIARALIEYIHQHIRAKTLFSTHFHELTSLAEVLTGVKNYTMAIKEEGDTIIFLRQVIPGKTDRSYGIHVARLAGMPEVITQRASEILTKLQEKEQRENKVYPAQMELFSPNPHSLEQVHPVVEELANLKIMTMTPLQALNKLYELQTMINEKPGARLTKAKRKR
jgi:DNA mismatch repair protein MutS